LDRSTENSVRADAPALISGVIEGFYGRPWSQAQRRELFTLMSDGGLGTYSYGPKDDLKLRAEWRSLYGEDEAAALKALVAACREAGLRFNCAVAPGLDMAYAEEADWRHLENKTAQLLDLGIRDFTLLFDDIPALLADRDAKRFATFAEAQCAVANHLLAFVRQRVDDGQFFFCPTEYCGRFATPNVRESKYLREIGERLDAGIEIFWTGPEIVSATLPSESLREVAGVLRRKPLIWDNLHANDYDIRRLYLGPYAGRGAQVLELVSGIITNPNCEYEANFVPLTTLASFVADAAGYQPRTAYLKALEAWRQRFSFHGGGSPTVGELELLGDLFYLPFDQGERAGELLRLAEELLSRPPANWGERYERLRGVAREVAELFERLTHLENRELLYTLYRYLWDVRNEVGLLTSYLAWLQTEPSATETFGPPQLVPNTYRGGLAAAIQRLLPVDESGEFLVHGARQPTGGSGVGTGNGPGTGGSRPI